MIDERRRRAAEHVIQVGGTFHMHAHKYRYMLWIYRTKVDLIGTIVFVVCASCLWPRKRKAHRPAASARG